MTTDTLSAQRPGLDDSWRNCARCGGGDPECPRAEAPPTTVDTPPKIAAARITADVLDRRINVMLTGFMRDEAYREAHLEEWQHLLTLRRESSNRGECGWGTMHRPADPAANWRTAR